MIVFEIDLSERDAKDGSVWARRSYIVEARNAIEALNTAYRHMDKDFPALSSLHAVDSLKRRDDIDAVL